MKSQDKLRTATLRMLLAAIQTEEVAGDAARDLSDAEVIKVLSREAKKRSESAEIYTQNGRGELAANEHAEARVIDEYLPTPLTEAEVADVVDTAIAQVAEDIGERPGMRQMGQVMKAATAIAEDKGGRRPTVGGGQGQAVAHCGGRFLGWVPGYSRCHDAFWLHPDDRTERA